MSTTNLTRENTLGIIISKIGCIEVRWLDYITDLTTDSFSRHRIVSTTHNKVPRVAN
jgi:hypothetical protein